MAAIRPTPDRMFLGAYVWDTLQIDESGKPSLRPIAGILQPKGVRALRLTVNLGQLRTYGIATKACPSRFRSSCFLDTPAFRNLVANPGFDVVAFTFHEMALSNWRMTKLDAMRRDGAAARAELKEFLGQLLPILKAQLTKKFIITNREGDQGLFCGSILRFIKSEPFLPHSLPGADCGRAIRVDRPAA